MSLEVLTATIGVAFAVAAVVVFRPHRGPALVRIADRAARRARIALPERAEDIGRRLLRTQRSGLLVALVVWVATTVALLALPPAPAGASDWVALGSVVLGGAAGSAAGAAHARRTVPDGGIRVARARSVALGDFVGRGERLAASAAVVVALAAVGLAVAVGRAVPVVLAVGVLVLVAVIASIVEAGHVLRRGRPAGSVLGLAWEDAIRAQALRQIVGATGTAGLYGAVAVALVLVASPQETARVAGLALALAAIAAGTGVVAAGVAGVRDRVFLLRLWPGASR